VGAIIGYVMGMLMSNAGRIHLIENVLVGVFGAFIGGDFVVAMMNKGIVNDKDFSVSSLAFAVTGAVVMLLILKLIRRAVGPMHVSKPKSRSR
jgi:uncharacterized membrane protein YeaQ/YmgE (transglycosylase-associated protein family)